MVRQLREAIHDVEEGIVEGMALTLSKTNGSIANAFRVTGSRRGSKFMLMGALLDTLMRVNHDRCDV